MELATGKYTEKKLAEVKVNLLEYCNQDTWAMAATYKKVQESI